MSRNKRTAKQLKELSEHLHYEVWMLTSLAHGIGSGIAGQGSIANALLESFVIHVRALMGFLYSCKPKSDDVIAQDYFDKSIELEELCQPLSEILIKAKHRTGKEVAHLTYARFDVTQDTKPWHFIGISNEISEVLNIFLTNVDKSKLGNAWNQ